MTSPRKISKAERDRWTVQRERFQLTDTRPPSPFRVFTPEQVVPSIMKKIGLERPMQEQALMQEWPDLVGPQIAKHTRPGRLDHGILFVYISNSAWLAELRRFGEKQILEKLQTRFGRKTIKGLRLQLDPDGDTRLIR